MANGNSIDEYKELNNNIRFYGNMRFAQLTLFTAITAALLTIVFTIEPKLLEPTRTVVKVGGMLATFVFWRMEERSTGYGLHFHKRIIELEKPLGYKGWTGRKMGNATIFSATNAVRLLYLCIFVFWLISISQSY